MKLFEDLPSTNMPITAESLNQIQDNLVVVSPTEPTGDNREKLWIQKGKNLFDKSKTTGGYRLDSSGNNYATSGYSVTDFISVSPNTQYSVNYSLTTNKRIAFYDEDKTFISAITEGSSFTTPSNAYYLKMGVETSSLDTTQLEQGSTATEYEAYIEPKIYVLNNNGVYEEFISNKETILYENTSGSNGETTLNDSVAKYKRIKIFFKTNNGTFNSVEVDNPNGKQVCLNSGSSSATEAGVYYLRTKEININDNKITTSKYLQIGLRAEGVTIMEDNKIYITKVVGIR